MSKYVKDLVASEYKSDLQGVGDLLLVNISGMNANANMRLRREFRAKNIRLKMIKNSLARRATEGTALAPAFEGGGLSAAALWGGEDIVSLAKEVIRLAKEKQYEPFAPLGGVMAGEKLSKAQVEEVSKWPSRAEQLSILVGQILSPGATLAAQLLGPGGALASQVKQKGEEKSDDSGQAEGAA